MIDRLVEAPGWFLMAEPILNAVQKIKLNKSAKVVVFVR